MFFKTPATKNGEVVKNPLKYFGICLERQLWDKNKNRGFLNKNKQKNIKLIKETLETIKNVLHPQQLWSASQKYYCATIYN